MEALRRIHACTDERQRTRLIEDFHADHYDLYRRFAKKHQHNLGVAHHFTDDLVQEVATVAQSLLMTFDPDREEHWSALLYHRSRSHLRDWARSSRHTGLTAASEHQRRHRELDRTRNQLAQLLQREPTDREVLHHWNNVEAPRRFSDPSRGRLATEADLQNSTPVPVEPTNETLDTTFTGLLAGIECLDFVRQVVNAATAVDPKLGEVAATWLADSTGDRVEVSTIKEVAAALNITSWAASQAIHRIRDIAHSIAVQALEWVGASWTDHGFTAEEAHNWASYGFGPVEASAWVNANITDPRQAARSRAHGHTPTTTNIDTEDIDLDLTLAEGH